MNAIKTETIDVLEYNSLLRANFWNIDVYRSQNCFIEVSNVSPLEGRNMMLHLSQVIQTQQRHSLSGKIFYLTMFTFFSFSHTCMRGRSLGGR